MNSEIERTARRLLERLPVEQYDDRGPRYGDWYLPCASGGSPCELRIIRFPVDHLVGGEWLYQVQGYQVHQNPYTLERFWHFQGKVTLAIAGAQSFELLARDADGHIVYNEFFSSAEPALNALVDYLARTFGATIRIGTYQTRKKPGDGVDAMSLRLPGSFGARQ